MWQLAGLVIIGLAVMIVLAGMTGGDDAEPTRHSAANMGAWSVRLLLFAVLIGGGWSPLRPKK